MSRSIHNFIEEADAVYRGGRVGVKQHLGAGVSAALDRCQSDYVFEKRRIDTAFEQARSNGVDVHAAVDERDAAIDQLLRQHGDALRDVCPQGDGVVTAFQEAYEAAHQQHRAALAAGVPEELALAQLNVAMGQALLQFEKGREALAL